MDSTLGAFVILPLAFYFVPALPPLWAPFLITWALAGIAIAGLWANGDDPSSIFQEPRGVEDALEKFLFQFYAVCWLSGGVVQGIRGVAHAKGYANYQHWAMVILGGVCAGIIGFQLLD